MFNSPSLITSDVFVHDNKRGFCSFTGHSLDNLDDLAEFMFAQLSLVFVAPLVVITVLYTAIAIALKRQNRALTDTRQNLQRHSEKKRRQAIRMAVTIVALFYICVIPSILLYFAPYWSLSYVSERRFLSLASFAFSSSSMVNPIICLSFVESYRRGLRNTLCPCRKTPDNMTEKREQVTLKEARNLSAENCRGVLRDTENCKETSNTPM